MRQREGAGPTEVCFRLHKQAQALVIILTVVTSLHEINDLLTEFSATTTSAEPILAKTGPEILHCLHTAFTHAHRGQADDFRGELLEASQRLAVLLRTDLADLSARNAVAY